MSINELLVEWSYRTEKGYPDMGNPSDILILKEILENLGLPVDSILDELGGDDEVTVVNDEAPSPEEVEDTAPVSKGATIKDIIDLLPLIQTDQEALLKMKKYLLNRKGEVGFFDKLTNKNISNATIDSADAPKELYQILSDNDDVNNYDIFDQPSFSELGVSGNMFDFYKKNSELSTKTILQLFNFFGTEGGRGVGKGEMAFALLFKDVKMASGAGDLDWDGRYLEVKGSKARLGGRDRAFSNFNNTLLGKLAIEFNKSDTNLVTLIGNLADEVDLDINDLLEAVIEFENEAHPKGNASNYFNIDIIQDPGNKVKNKNTSKLRKAFCKNYITNYSNTHGVSHFIWWNSEVHGGKSSTPGEAKTKWGTYVVFTPGDADGLVDNDTILTGMPSLDNLDPTTIRP